MRDILFRGKRKDNGEWVYWNIYGEFCTSNGRRIRLTRKTPYGEKYYYYIYELKQLIDPETVGQYTGLTDKNGKKIFDSDIIQAVTIDTNNKLNAVVRLGTFVDDNTDKEYLGCYIELNGIKLSALTAKKYKNRFEVIGNIYDNKEILDVK